jgi:hypothetical protein
MDELIMQLSPEGSDSDSDPESDEEDDGVIGIPGGEMVVKHISKKLAFIAGDTGLLSFAMHHNGTHQMESLFDEQVRPQLL